MLLNINDKGRIVLPAEWAEQQFVQLTWPHANSDWRDMLDEVNECFLQIAKEIIKFQDLLIVAPNTENIKSLFTINQITKITFVEMPTNDTWARDHGGISVFENGEKVICDFTFNGWGMKFAANHDNQITKNLFEKGVLGDNTIYKDCLNLVLEGGSIESDGEGTLLTTSDCLLSANRNNITEEALESKLKELFGLEQVLWLHHGYLAGDDTDSHIDTLARFCDKETIAYVKCEDVNDEHFDELQKMEFELQNFTTLKSEKYKLIPLPMADKVIFEGDRLPATYANFLIVNGAVLMPAYNSPKDKIAEIQLQRAFPDRKIIQIDCIPLIKQHGSLHCVTMQYV